MEKYEPQKQVERLDFENLATALANILDLTRESLITAFNNSQFNQKYSGRISGGEEKHFSRKGRLWTIDNIPDDEGLLTITSTDGHKYRVGTATVRQLNKATKEMIATTVPHITEHPDKIGEKFSRKSSPPDKFEIFPGIHYADQ